MSYPVNKYKNVIEGDLEAYFEFNHTTVFHRTQHGISELAHRKVAHVLSREAVETALNNTMYQNHTIFLFHGDGNHFVIVPHEGVSIQAIADDVMDLERHIRDLSRHPGLCGDDVYFVTIADFVDSGFIGLLSQVYISTLPDADGSLVPICWFDRNVVRDCRDTLLGHECMSVELDALKSEFPAGEEQSVYSRDCFVHTYCADVPIVFNKNYTQSTKQITPQEILFPVAAMHISVAGELEADISDCKDFLKGLATEYRIVVPTGCELEKFQRNEVGRSDDPEQITGGISYAGKTHGAQKSTGSSALSRLTGMNK